VYYLVAVDVMIILFIHLGNGKILTTHLSQKIVKFHLIIKFQRTKFSLPDPPRSAEGTSSPNCQLTVHSSLA